MFETYQKNIRDVQFFLRVLDSLESQPRDKSQGKVASLIKDVTIIPNNLQQCRIANGALLIEYFNEDLQSSLTFQQELT